MNNFLLVFLIPVLQKYFFFEEIFTINILMNLEINFRIALYILDYNFSMLLYVFIEVYPLVL